MTSTEARGMLTFHQRIAQAARAEAAKPANRKYRDRLLRDAEVADRRAAECQAVCQIARLYGEG